jgi:mono/diheme cytochrome c family protein
MPPQTYLREVDEVLLAFFFWLSAFVCLIGVVVVVLLGVSVFKLLKGPVHIRRYLLPTALLVTLCVHNAIAEAPKIPLGCVLLGPSLPGTVPAGVRTRGQPGEPGTRPGQLRSQHPFRDSPYDRYVNGDQSALSAEAREGLGIFQGKGNCIACHVGPNLTDERFHNTGVAWRGGKLTDHGRFAITGKNDDRGAFKPPTLREVARTAPYMHDGSLATLEDVIQYYDRGGNRNPGLDPEIRPLHLSSAERQNIIAFLRCLNSTTHEAGK